MNFNPTEYVDVSKYIDTKLEMLECHESQVAWIRDHMALILQIWFRLAAATAVISAVLTNRKVSNNIRLT